MEEPKYILKTNRADRQYTKGKQPFSTIRIIVWIVVAIIIVGSLIFRENLFFELSWTARGILISLLICSFSWGEKNIRVPGKLEIRFYEDYGVLYIEKAGYSYRLSRMEYWKFYYKDVTQWIYDYNLKQLNIYASNLEAIWYDYNSDGTVPDKPTYHRNIKNMNRYFYVWGNDYEEIILCLKQFLNKEPILRNIEYKDKDRKW